jgi:phage gpG-like protein
MSGYVRVMGVRQAKLRVKAIKKRAGDVSGAWPSVGAYLSRVATRQFVTEGAYLGRPWAPLKSEYRLWKIRSGYSRKILVRTGGLRNEFTKRPMQLEEYMGNSARFGSTSDLAAWQHRGTTRNGKPHIPARPIIYVTPGISKDVRDILAKRIIGRGKR